MAPLHAPDGLQEAHRHLQPGHRDPGGPENRRARQAGDIRGPREAPGAREGVHREIQEDPGQPLCEGEQRP